LTGVNVAVTDLAASIVTAQVDAVPVQAPVQPVNVEPGADVAIKVTLVPTGTLAMQELAALVPVKRTLQEKLGSNVTMPPAVPTVVTVRGNVVEANVAVTDLAAFIVTVQVRPVPLHAPPQPVNAEPLSGAAVSVTLAPTLEFVVQAVPHEMPPPETLPLPVPALVTVSA
jgi:hypothetical protein